MKTTILLLGAFLTSSLTGLAGNEPLLKNNGQIDLNFQYTKFNSVFDNDGELKSIPPIQFSSFNLNARYGLTDRITVNITAPVLCSARNSADNGFNIAVKSKSGIGDLALGLNYALTKQNKIQPVITIYQNLGTGNYDKDGLSTGFGDFANSVYFDLFYEVNSHWIVNGNIGYQNRKKNFKNDFLGNIFINYNKKDKFSFSVFMKGKLPFNELSNQENVVNYGLYKNSEGFFRYGANAVVSIRKNLSLTINYENYLKGQFIGNGPILTAGISINFLKKESTSESEKE